MSDKPIDLAIHALRVVQDVHHLVEAQWPERLGGGGWEPIAMFNSKDVAMKYAADCLKAHIDFRYRVTDLLDGRTIRVFIHPSQIKDKTKLTGDDHVA